MDAVDKLPERIPGGIRFNIPDAFEDGGGLLIECHAYEMGPRGGRSHELRLTRNYWRELLPMLSGRL